MSKTKKMGLLIAVLVVGVGGALFFWQSMREKGLPEGFASSNGRLEAVEIDIAAKIAGRVKAILVNEGEFVTAGQVLAEMDTAALEAQKREAEALLRQAQNAIEAARSHVAQRQSEKAAAQATVVQRQAEVGAAKRRLERSEALLSDQAVAAQQVDDDRAMFLSTQAILHAAEAQVKVADAAIATARSQVISAESNVEAARATIERIGADIDDSVLKAPRDGRVQYRVAQPGEVLAAGGNVLNMIDLADAHMTFFLPTAEAGRVAIGSEVRLVFDAAPEYVVPAQVSFVAAVAQFTPKTVETASERQKLMFRIKAKIPEALLRKYIADVKTGLPGMAYVRLDPQASWPAELQANLLP
ncbi:MAG: HlyD family efflux transporter periplasmic adaptor subunit [Desulfuromonadales bacterium]